MTQWCSLNGDGSLVGVMKVFFFLAAAVGVFVLSYHVSLGKCV